MEDKELISGNALWEKKYGYSRAVRVGSFVFFSGTTATNTEGEIVGLNDPYQQTKQIYQNIASYLASINGDLSNIVRVRIYTTDVRYKDEIMKAHRELFSEIRPASTFVEVSKLFEPEMLVEIEVDAVL